MKKLLVTVLCSLFFLFELFSQISIDYSDFAPIGQNFIMAIDEFVIREKVTIDDFGTSSWDFSKLEIDDYDTIRHLAPENTRYGEFFDSTNYAQYFGYYEIDYYYLDEKNLVQVGVIGDYLDLDAPALVPFQQHVTRYEFPLEFGKTFTDSAYQKFKTPYTVVDGLDSIKADIYLIEKVEFDAYGTVKTKMGTYETLREKQILKKRVKAYKYSMYGWTPAPEYDDDLTQTIYRWYAKGEQIPIVIAEVNSKGFVTKIKYKYEEEMRLIFDTKHVACRGGKNGKIDLTVRGGIPDYTYIWSNGDTIEDPVKLTANTYTVIATDNKGKTVSGGYSVAEPQDSLLMDITINQISCYGKHDGNLSVKAIGGIPPYFIIWTTDSVGNSISNLFEGKYGVIIRDDNRCFIWDTVEIVTPKEPLTADVEDIPVKCREGNDGQLEAFGYGGTEPYTYLWSNGDTAKIAKNLSAGEYTVVVTDNHGCTKERTKILTQPATALEIELTAFPVNCNGGDDGFINAIVKGGGAPYNYFWSNGKEEKDIENLPKGVYTLNVTDDYGCKVNKSIEVTEPEDSLYVEFSKNDVLCFGQNSGSINLTVYGGTPEFTFFWEHGDTKQNVENLYSSIYNVEVTDQKGCIAKKKIIINQPAEPLIIQASPKNITCLGNQDGAIDILVSGGTLPYTYKWSNGKTQEDLYDLSAGQYSIKVTDANGCEKEKTFNVEAPVEKFTATSKITPITCSGKNDGKIEMIVSGGVAPYYYKWSTDAEVKSIDRLKPGVYTVLITDEYGCTLNETVTLNDTEELAAEADITAVSKSNDGAIELAVTGGTKPYTYAWSNGFTTSKIEKLSKGEYSVTVKDANGCKLVEKVIVE